MSSPSDMRKGFAIVLGTLAGVIVTVIVLAFVMREVFHV